MPHRLAAECHRLGEVAIGRQGERAADDLRPDRVELAHGLVHERPERRGIAHPPLDDLDESPTHWRLVRRRPGSRGTALQIRLPWVPGRVHGGLTIACRSELKEMVGRHPGPASVSHKGTTIGRRRGPRHPSRVRVAFPGTRRAVTAGRRRGGTGVPRHPGPDLSGRRAEPGSIGGGSGTNGRTANTDAPGQVEPGSPATKPAS